MIHLVLLLFSILPLCEVVDVQLSIPTHQHDIFRNYSNGNFSQTLVFHRDSREITAHIKNSNYLSLNLNFAVTPDRLLIARLSPRMRKTVLRLLAGCNTFRDYFTNITNYLRDNITYSPEDNLLRAPEGVIINKKADCVGYANLVQLFLDAAGIKHAAVKGFYLKPEGKATLIPVPHRWLEIYLSDKTSFFYDPQHQTFSADYLAVRDGTDFREIRRFKVNIIKKSKKIIN